MESSPDTEKALGRSPRWPTLLVNAAVVVPVVLLGYLVWTGYGFYTAHVAEDVRAIRLSQGAARILHLDEVLTMSAKMAAATGDKAWIDRYRRFEPKLDRLIQEVKALAPTVEGLQDASATGQANAALVQMEKRSFELVLQGRKEEAWALLTGPEYERQKQAYAGGMQALMHEMEIQRQDGADSARLHFRALLIGQGLVVALFLGLWYVALRIAVPAWRRKASQLRVIAGELQLSEERIRVTLGSIGDGLIAVDTQHRVTQMNRVSERLTGWTLEETRGRPVQDVLRIINEKTRVPAKNPIDEVLRTGEVQGLTDHSLLVARDGTERAIADSAAPIRGDDGAIRGVVLVFRDVTQERSRERKLRESEERFRTVFENATDGILIADSDRKRFRGSNPAICRMLGYSPEEIPSLGVIDIHPEKDLPYVLDQVERQIRKEISLARDLPVKRKDGSVFYADVCAFPIPLDGEECLVGFFRDVTERKQAGDLLLNSECKYRTLFEGTGDAVMLLLDETGFLECNQAALNVFGCACKDELIGKHPGDFSPPMQPDGQDSRAAAHQRMAEAMATGRARFEWLHCRKDRTEFPAEVLLTRMDLQDRSVLQAVVRDVTERKRLERELTHLASHDPLTGLANRRLFEDALTRAVARARRGAPSVLLMFDVDRFKAVNDALGHAAGDDLLVWMAQRVQGGLREEDLLARIGGDEFAVLLEGPPGRDAAVVAERIRQVVDDAACPADGGVHPTLSIGLVEIDGQHDVVSLIAKADAAMYEAKDQGRNRIVCAEAAPAA